MDKPKQGIEQDATRYAERRMSKMLTESKAEAVKFHRIIQDLRKIAENRLELAYLGDLITELEKIILKCPNCARIQVALADLTKEYNTSSQKRDRPEWTGGFLSCLNMIMAVVYMEKASYYCSIKDWLEWGYNIRDQGKEEKGK